MSFISWLEETELLDEFDLKERKHQPHPDPIHSRPCLESLEERTLLDANSGMVEGSFGNLNLNSNFNFGSNGFVPPQQNLAGPSTNGGMGSNGQHAFDPSGLVSSGTVAQASSAAFLAQDQPYAQFRVFGVNSQGTNPQLAQITNWYLYLDAFGFGSGTQPNAPWKPNAYNLGLANRQFNNSTLNDNGFASVPPWAQHWSTPVARAQQARPNNPNNPLDDDQVPLLQKDEPVEEMTEQRVTHHSSADEQPPQQHRRDLDVLDKGEDLQALMQQQTSDTKSQVETPLNNDGSISDTLLLSTFSPAQMAALIAGLPGMPSATGGSEGGAETGEAVEAPPE